MVISEEVSAMNFSENSPSLSIDGMLMDSTTIASVLREAEDRAHVKELTLRNVAIDRVVAEAAEGLFSQNRNWTKIDTIHCTGFLSRLIQATLSRTQQFSFTGSVPIAHNPRYSLDVSSLQALGQALKDFEGLKTLSLKGTRLPRRGLEAFCAGLAESSSLQTLQMSHCALESEQVALLSSALQQNQHLTALSLAHCKFGLHNPTTTHSSAPPQFATLVESLVTHPKLQSLNIYGIYCNPRSTEALSSLLRNPHTQLWHLGLKNNLRHPEDKLTITNLLQALEHNTTLTYLQISGNNVEDVDMEQVAEIITHSNHTLRALSLTANNIEDERLLSFARRLTDMKALRYLDVQRNRFTNVSKTQIIAALKDNMELERLDLDGTWDATKSFYLSLNKGGRRLLQSSNNTPLGLWPLVLERANTIQFGRNQPHANLDVLYCLFLQGPAALFQQPRKRKRSKDDEEQKPNADEEKPRAKRMRLNIDHDGDDDDD
jgi:Ran GTPase-activating protein (RanGAP) involved in mRNA processing and transport